MDIRVVFENLSKKYLSKKERFKKVIDRFQEKKSDSLYQKSSQLLKVADNLNQSLQAAFAQKNHGAAELKEIKQQLKAFKKTYKELYQMSKSSIRQWVEAIGVALLLALVLRNFVFGLYHVPSGSAEHNILVGDRLWGNKMVYFVSPVKRGELVIFDNPTFDYDRSSMINYWWQRYIGFPIPLLGLGIGPENWVKRVIAVPGDVIEGRLESGKTVIYLNNQKLDEPYVNKFPLIAVNKNRGFIPFSNIGPLKIPGFLCYETTVRHYTYDPSKPYSQQPFYSFDESDVVKVPGTNEPELLHAYSPTYDHRTMMCMDVFGPYIVPEGKYWVMGDSRKNSVDSRWWLFLDEKLIHGRASFVIYSIDSEEAFWLFDLIKHPIDFWTKHIRWNRFFSTLHGYENE